MSAREFELCRSRPRQGRVRCRLQRRNFRIGFYRIRLRFDQPAIDYQLLIRQFDARRLALAVPPAPAGAGRRGSGGNAHTRMGMPRRARVPAPATRPFGASREYRDEYGIELKKTKGERDPEIAPSDRTRSAARLHATRAPAPRDRVSTHIRHEGARLVRTTAASAIRLELGGRLRWENHSQILQTCPRTQLK